MKAQLLALLAKAQAAAAQLQLKGVLAGAVLGTLFGPLIKEVCKLALAVAKGLLKL